MKEARKILGMGVMYVGVGLAAPWILLGTWILPDEIVVW